MQFKATEVNNHLVTQKIYEHYNTNMIPILINFIKNSVKTGRRCIQSNILSHS